MTMLEADYLIVGAGAGGLAFADTLLSENPTATMIIVDERAEPGGHWVDAYDFVRTHQPAALYGVNSTPLGAGRVDTSGFNAGHCELASAAEIRAYYDNVMRRVLLATGRVSYFPSSRYDFEERTVTRNGKVTQVRARKIVDSTYVAGEIPSRHTPSYQVADGVRHGPVNALSRTEAQHYVVIGAGKTGMDACIHLLERSVDPDAITWIKPQDMWLYNRAHYQPAEHLLSEQLEGMAAQMEIAASAQAADEILLRLEQAGVLMRVDRDVVPTAYRCATITGAELNQVRRIKNVVRLGRVRGIEPDRIVLADGEIGTSAEAFHVDCTAKAVAPKPIKPIFQGECITLQFVRMCQPTFCAALIALVEAHFEDETKKNQLCAVVPSPERAVEWLSMSLQSTVNSFAWMQEPVIVQWLARSRLNSTRGLMHSKEELTAEQNAARARIRAATPGAVANLGRLLATRNEEALAPA
ncbi:MAG TPA: NAD(P)/FAD-dependent oxidoreductase [Candidatus Binatia bacterium]|nr:NAD(P)/FAD-dependent oxidoreductase [Candidatus Binatia bacterium]